jgi:hypothetical protein
MYYKQLLLIAVSVVATTTAAFAQPAADPQSATKVLVARRLYDEGVEAVGKSRWSLAHDRFKASYEMAPRVLTLFNLAGSQAQTGRLVEASESYRKFLRETTDGRYPELRTDATTQLELLEKQVAQLTLDVANIDSSDTIAIDEIDFPHAAIREPIPMNPGPHVVRITRGDAAVANRSITLAPGAAEIVHIEVPVKPVDLNLRRPAPGPPSPTDTVVDTTKRSEEPRRSVLRSPWFWTGVAVVVVGGAATGAYFMTRSDGPTLTVH